MNSSVVISEISDLSSPFLFQGESFDNLIRQAADSGFEMVEIQIKNPLMFPWRKIDKLCQSIHCGISSIATGLAVKDGLSLSSRDENIRKLSVKYICDHIHLASLLGDNIKIQLGLIIGKKSNIPGGIYYLTLLQSLEEIKIEAEKNNVTICIEPINHFENDSLNTWSEVDKYIQFLSSKRFLISMDLYHMHFEEKNIISTMRMYGFEIGSVQLMDDNRKPPGQGCFSFQPIIRELLSTGYNGDLIFECTPTPTSEKAARECLNFYNKIINYKHTIDNKK